MNLKAKEILKTSLKIFFAVALIFWLISSGKLNLAEVRQLLFSRQAIFLVIPFALATFASTYRWQVILHSQKIMTPFWENLRFTLIGFFFNLLVPGGVGGDVVKAYYVAHSNPQQKLRAVLTIFMDRLLGLFTMVLLAFLVMVIEWPKVSTVPELKILLFIFGAITFAFCIFWAIIFSNRLSQAPIIFKIIYRLPHHEKIEKLYLGFTEYKALKPVFVRTLLISFISQICAVFFFVIAGQNLGFEIPLETYFFVVPIGFMTMAIPISPAGIGVGQAAFYYLFNVAIGQKTSLGTSTITAYQLMTIAFSLAGAYFYVRQKKIEPAPVIE